jgi:ribose 5-phosphate isomerase B
VNKKNILIGSDHAGFELKELLKTYLNELGYDVKDEGTYSTDRADYPDYAHRLAEDIINKEAELGVLLCGSANGVSMAANKHRGVRSAIAWNAELATLARTHNDANVLSLPARYITVKEAKEILVAFLDASFEGGRHAGRVNKIDKSI